MADHSTVSGCIDRVPLNRGDREHPSCRCACSKWARKLPSDAARCARTWPWHSGHRISTAPRLSSASAMPTSAQTPPGARAPQTSSCAALRVTAVTLVTVLSGGAPWSRVGVGQASVDVLSASNEVEYDAGNDLPASRMGRCRFAVSIQKSGIYTRLI